MQDGSQNLRLHAEFSDGEGSLLLWENRLVFVGSSSVDWALLSDQIKQAGTNREFFLSCVESWFRASERPDLVLASVSQLNSAVLVLGRVEAVVHTDVETVNLDPTGSAFAVERIVPGRLRMLTFGCESTYRSRTWIETGLVGASSFVVSISDGQTPVSPPILDKSDVAVEEFKAVPSSSTPFSSRVSAAMVPSEGSSIKHDQTLPREPIVGTQERMDLIDSVDNDELDGLTVWPTAGRPFSPQTGEHAHDLTSSTVDARLPERNQEENSADPEAFSGDHDGLAIAARLVEPPAVQPSGEWEPPPAEFLSNGSLQSGEKTRASNDEHTLRWEPIASLPVVGNSIDESELTMMAGDLERLRKSFVAVAPGTMNRETDAGVFGAYCYAGHFTDAAKPACLFCGAEVDLSTGSRSERPPLGTLTFDDGRTLPLVSNVLIGRRPNDRGIDASIVAFDDDKLLSRTHVEIRLVDWQVVAVDQQSINGTTIEHRDGRRITAKPNLETPLEVGSIVQFGNHWCTVTRS